jgi:hypothetical protein
MDVHDIDEPAEVIAAADRYHGAATDFADRIGAVVRSLVLPVRPQSPLDRALMARLDQVTAGLDRAATDHVARAGASRGAAVAVVRALEEADRTGAGLVRDSVPD